MLEQIGKHSAALSLLSLFASSIYDYAFLRALGLDFGQISTSISDHVRTAMIWAPSMALVYGASVFLGVAVGAQSMFDQWKPGPLVHTLVRAVVAVWLVTIFLLASPLVAIAFLVMSVALMVLLWPASVGTIFQMIGQRKSILISVTIALVGFVFIRGWLAGERMLAAEPDITVEWKVGEGVRSLSVRGVRWFGSSLLVVRDDYQVDSLQGDQIRRIGFGPEDPTRAMSMLCYLKFVPLCVR